MIYGDRVRLRAVEREDLPKFQSWLNDPDVRAGLMMHLPLSTDDEGAWYEGMRARPAPEHTLAIEVKREDGWKMIGSCGFHAFDWRIRMAEMGIFIGEKSLWSQGYGTEAVRLLVQHGFQTLNLNRIALEVYENNPRAIRVYEKVGFILEGRKRQAMYRGGRYLDVLLMSILRSDWEKQPR